MLKVGCAGNLSICSYNDLSMILYKDVYLITYLDFSPPHIAFSAPMLRCTFSVLAVLSESVL